MSVNEVLDRLFAGFRGWCGVWGLSRLAREARIEFSDELGLALGMCDLRAGHIVLNAVLLRPENEALLFETLCHEAAHLVAYLRYGPGVAEHGVEWQEYMERAGYRPRAVIPAGRVPGLEGVVGLPRRVPKAATGPGDAVSRPASRRPLREGRSRDSA